MSNCLAVTVVADYMTQPVEIKSVYCKMKNSASDGGGVQFLDYRLQIARR